MQDTQLYAQLLGVRAPWRVQQVELDVETQEVRVRVEGTDGARWLCPECGQVCRVHDYREERRWRHLDSCGFTTWLLASLPRVECVQHGVKTVQTPWSSPGSRFTLAFECFAIVLLQATKVQSRAAALLRLSAGQMHDLMARAVTRGLARRDRERDREAPMPALSLDEKSWQRGHKYMTVLSDPQGRRVLDVVPERTLESTAQLLETTLSPPQKEAVKAVSMDFWPAFMSARAAVLPRADTVHDRYHVAAYLGQAVDLTRRAEHARLQKAGSSVLSHTRYLWLKQVEQLTYSQRLTFLDLRNSELLTARVWSFKETFREFFGLTSVENGRAFLQNWCEAALALGHPPLTRVALMLQRHEAGLLAYLRHRISNGFAESLNSQIQEIKTVARGYRSFDSFRVAILFFLGRLDLDPQLSP